jgi:hypothetical protein
MCYEAQQQDAAANENNATHPGTRRLKGKSAEPISVLGMVNLNDLDRLHSEGQTGRGWIACKRVQLPCVCRALPTHNSVGTTDAIFLEKPSYYDLLIDLTTSTPNKATRPTFYSSKPLPPQPSNPRGPTHRLSTTRFAWSDIKLVSFFSCAS